MDAKESKEMKILRKKPHKTEKEIEQYKKLLEYAEENGREGNDRTAL